jgi:hypothetical protein
MNGLLPGRHNMQPKENLTISPGFKHKGKLQEIFSHAAKHSS